MALEFPNIDPVALSLGPVDIRWYALAYITGFLLGWWYILRLIGSDNGAKPDKNDIDDFISWAIVGVILGGRFGYTMFYNFEYYAAHPLDIFKIWQGGMAFHGGILGVIVAMVVFSRIRNIPLLKLSDVVACAAPIGLFFGRISNFINGELYGRATDVSWAFVFPRGGDVPRHPSQIYEALLEGAVLFVVLFALSRLAWVKDRPGVLSAVFLMLYGLFRCFVELFRQPDAHIGFIFADISMGQMLSVPMVIVGAGLIVYASRSPRGANA